MSTYSRHLHTAAIWSLRNPCLPPLQLWSITLTSSILEESPVLEVVRALLLPCSHRSGGIPPSRKHHHHLDHL